MHAPHCHHHHPAQTGRILVGSVLITAGFVVLELVLGWSAGSLALLSDAGHNFTDALALMMALFGHYVQRRPANEQKTYGYHRAGVLAAFVNALVLVALSLVLLYECVERFQHLQPVATTTMFWVAAAGLLVNAAIMWGLHREQKNDLNVRAAFLHMLGDALGSVAIIVGAWVIRQTGWLWVDPLLSVLISLLILYTAWDVIRESLNILLEGLPRGLQLREVLAELRTLPQVQDVHDLHVWSLGSHMHALSCHLLIGDLTAQQSSALVGLASNRLRDRFQIHHSTIQVEYGTCADEASVRSHNGVGHAH